MNNAAETARQVAIAVLRASNVIDHRGVNMADALAKCASIVDIKTATAAGVVLLVAKAAAAQSGARGYGALTAAANAIESLSYGESAEPGLAKARANAHEAGIEVG
jgi:hypothetical protein